MVSNFALTCWTVHVGVMRRSEWRRGSSEGEDVDGVVIATGTSVGVGWKDILYVYQVSLPTFGQRRRAEVRIRWQELATTVRLEPRCIGFKDISGPRSVCRNTGKSNGNRWNDMAVVGVRGASGSSSRIPKFSGSQL